MKRWIQIVVFVVCGATVLCTLVAGTLIWWRAWNPAFMDSGPYVGATRPVPEGQPGQVFPIWDGKTLLVYPPNSTNVAPIVVLRNNAGSIQWAIGATGKHGCQVSGVRFHAFSTFPWTWPRIVGVVDWSCGGVERTVWKLDRTGMLKEYWYSW